jgi:peptide/nickel transport system permease protein
MSPGRYIKNLRPDVIVHDLSCNALLNTEDAHSATSEEPTGIASFVVRRVLLLIPVMLGVTLITFIISFVTVPDPVRAWTGPRATAGAIAALTARFHLKSPVYVQYYYYMANLLNGNWGIVPSSGRPVLYDLEHYFPATAELALVAIIVAIVVGIPLGVVAAMYQGRTLDHAIRFFYLGAYSSPPFFVALAVILLFGYVWKIFPTSGQLTQGLSFNANITGMVIVDSLLKGNIPIFLNALDHIVLPAATLSLIYFGIVTRVTRASLLEVFQKDFIRASYSKGLRRRTVIFRHALRNALIPTVTVLGLLLAGLFGGSVVVETIFNWPGIGLYAYQSISSFDFPSVMGVTLLLTICVVLANLAADILYAVLDPRIKV